MKVATVTAVIGKTRRIVEQRFHTLNAPALLPRWWRAFPYADGIPVKSIKATAHERAAA
jgi:hypothetical protein